MTDPTRTPLTAESEALLARWSVDAERERDGKTGYLDWGEFRERLAAIEAAAAAAERERWEAAGPFRRRLEEAKAEGAAAERARIAAALPEALAAALHDDDSEPACLHIPMVLEAGADYEECVERTSAVLAHHALRAILAPAGDVT